MNKEESKYKILSLILAIAIIAVVVFLIVPKYFPADKEEDVARIDFSSSAWIENFVEERVGVFDKDFFLSTAFSYNTRSNRMILTYATQKSVDEVRDHYLSLPGAEMAGRNDETSLNISADGSDHTVRIYNYYSPISRVVELELTLDPIAAEKIIIELEEAFPAGELEDVNEIQLFTRGDIFGGYVRYRYDELDAYAFPYLPIYSRAYLFEGTEEDFFSALEAMNRAFPDYRYDETQDVYYYRIGGKIISVSYFVTDSGEQIVSISIQEEGSSGP